VRAEPKTGHRLERLQQVVREEIEATLADEIGDPALSEVRITNVVLSVDYRSARVYYVLPPPDDRVRRDEAARALVRATPFLRHRLADAAEIKRVPDLKFVFEGHVIRN
jgi:ribosome-binding factor A